MSNKDKVKLIVPIIISIIIIISLNSCNSESSESTLSKDYVKFTIVDLKEN